MSKEKGKTQNEKRKLTRQEKKQIDALIRQAKGDGKPHTAQDSIPFERMYKDGICRLANGRYSKCIEFEDINYQLAQPDDKTAIFEALCDMYNSFDASISVQLSLISRHANKEDFKSSITIAPQNDDFDSIRTEYTEMLQTQLERGNNGLIKTKFLTFTIEAKDIKSARARLARIETDTLNHFKVIGAAARVLDGKQRLEVLYGLFHPDGERFNFAWEWLPASGLSVKDFIAPSSFRFGDGRMFQMGGKFGAVSFLQIAAPELSDRMLADFMEAENGIVVNLHIQSIDHNEAIKTIKRKITDLDRMKIEEQKKAIRSGYDMDIIPSDLATYGGEAKNLLRDLQSRNERMFLLEEYAANGYEPYSTTAESPVFDKLPSEQQQALSDTVKDTLQMLVDADKRIYGDITGKTLEAIAAQGYSYKDGQLEKQQTEATPDSLLTGETVRTPRGNFYITDMSREQIEAAGFGFHHASEDGKYLIMGNGTQAYAIAAEQPQRDNPLKHVEDTIEQNDNNFDGIINNTPQTPTVADFEQRAKAGEAISVTDLAKAVKAEKQEQPQKKPSILKKLDEYKKQAAQQPKDKQKEHKKDLEV